MLSLHHGCRRIACSRPPAPQRWASSAVKRKAAPAFSFTLKKAEGDGEQEDGSGDGPADQRGENGPATYGEFLKEHEHFKLARPKNYFARQSREDKDDDDAPRQTVGQVPFAMNPSFKPPPPISDALRSRMYAQYMDNPDLNSVRALSQRYHISLKRVEAILRLKGLEAAHVKGKQLQTGFQHGMEWLLGVQQPSFADLLETEEASESRTDVHEADMLEQLENRDAERQRFQRQYWESMDDDGKARTFLIHVTIN
ncbi:hypothetical protein HMN09_00884300 [Mycena chlorophos]|uniref:Uncharacterized protein n=1 Tax=Mycena chlorophos TaxID=658473 RepID=A0A8H6SR99_MYCCL|nr:hypothetical protein HMN09_00884300 [Mycena chlorophos]